MGPCVRRVESESSAEFALRLGQLTRTVQLAGPIRMSPGCIHIRRPGGWLGAVALAGTGFVLVSSFSITVALGQAYLPKSLGMAAGLIVGLAIGTGGIGVTILGWVADHWGVFRALHLVAALPVAGLVAALCLPEPRH